MQNLRIVYPRGEKNLVSVVTARSHDLDRWDLASNQVFSLENADQAWDYAYELASKHGLAVEDDRREGRRHDFLENRGPHGEAKIFQWSSERFSDHSPGFIMVSARTAEEARDKATARYKIENTDWDKFDSSGSDKFCAFLKDLLAEPSVVEVAFIFGSS